MTPIVNDEFLSISGVGSTPTETFQDILSRFVAILKSDAFRSSGSFDWSDEIFY